MVQIYENESNNFQLSKHLVSLPQNLIEREVEPPSPIVKDKQFATDQKSDDPLSQNVYMIMGDSSDESREGFSVCAWSARTGLSYIGTSSSVVS